MRVKAAFLLVAGLLLSGCVPEAGGAGAGAGGSPAQLIAALGDGVIGADLGARLSKRDRLKALEAEYRALEYGAPGAPVAWTGTAAGVAGSATAGQPYRVGSQDCRQLTAIVHLDAADLTRRGAACRNGDGSWTPLG